MSGQTQAERDAVTRSVLRNSAMQAHVKWPAFGADADEPAGELVTLVLGHALVDAVVRTDDGDAYVHAVAFGGAWADPNEFGDDFCRLLEKALDTARHINLWARKS